MTIDTQCTVLVVEDILSARETVINLLRALGFSHFVEAENGEVARKKLLEHEVGLIISDWNMPFMNGLSLLKAVREQESSRYIPFILLTSKSEMDAVALASDEGVSGYLVKPVTIRALAETLAKIGERSGEKEFDLLKAEIAALCAAKNFSTAQSLLQQFESDYPQYGSQIQYEQAKMFVTIGEIERADAIINKILLAQPLFAKGWAIKARIFLAAQQWENALKAIEKALGISCHNGKFYVIQGKAHLGRGDQRAARMSFMTALNVDSKNDQIKQDIWNAYLDLDLVEEVQKEFGSYLFSVLTCDTLNNMAVAYRRKGELGKALEIYQTALTKDPDNPKVLFNMAVAYMNRKEYVKARDLLLHALGNDIEFAEAKKLLSQVTEIIRRSESV